VLGFREFENLYIRVNSSVYLNYNFFLKIKTVKELLNYKRFRAIFPFY